MKKYESIKFEIIALELDVVLASGGLGTVGADGVRRYTSSDGDFAWDPWA
jgi:hypothetical protein